jgi:hypothetical protein
LDDVIEFPKVKVLSEDEALDYLRREGPIEGISKFAKLVGWERTRAQRMLARWQRDGAVVLKPGGPGGKTVISVPHAAVNELPAVRAPAQLPVPHDAQPPAQDAHSAHPVARPRGQLLGSISAAITPASTSAIVLFLVAFALGGTGVTMNARYAASLGSSDEGAIVLALVGVAVDVLAMVLPSVAVALWRRGNQTLAIVPWCVWPIMVALSLMASAGYASVHIGDVLAERSRAVTTTVNTASDIQRWRDERKTISETRSVAELEIQIQRERPKVDRIDRDAWDVTRGCTRLTADAMKACAPILPLRQALETAKRKDRLDEDISKAEALSAGATPVASADPQAEVVSAIVGWLSRGTITPSPADIAHLRIIGLIATPSMAGVILVLAMALITTRPISQSPRG